ncbi:MAG: hypothetical protein WCP09_03390 [Candidatus Taylorbacteria bacterium]
MKFKEFVQSKHFSKIIYTIGGLLVALVIFQAGIFVGYRNAAFSISWDKAHYGNARDPRSIFAPFGRDADDMNPHGAIGEVISVKLPLVMVKGPSGNEAIILIGSTTSIRSMRNQASTSDIRIGEQLVTVGTPDDQGQIHATLIRIMPSFNNK